MKSNYRNCTVAAALGLALLLVRPDANAQAPGEPVRIPGHVLDALSSAAKLPRAPEDAGEQLTFAVVLNRSDAAGFEAFKKAFHDPASPGYHVTMTADDLTARFGPSQQAYDTVLQHLQQNGLTLVAGSANRLTLTVRGTRAQIERALGLSISNYQLGNRRFYANDTDPAFPASLAPLIHGVSGLANLAQPHAALPPNPATPAAIGAAYNGNLAPFNTLAQGGLPPGITGAGQTIGLIEFDSYYPSDVSNWLNVAGLPASMINQVSVSAFNGGTTPSACSLVTPRCGQTEVLLDIDSALGMAPGANVIVFEGPTSTDFGTAVNSAVTGMNGRTGGHGGILSMSWSKCEYEISNSDADNAETLLEGLPLIGMSFFTSTGDNGSTCVSPSNDGSLVYYPNRIAFPADAPSAVAVGGTTLDVGAGNSYQREGWWVTGSGSGGFGTSWHFARPSYQAPYNSGSSRSVPDVSADADPATGISVCQGVVNGLPICGTVGGTSMSAPLWAGIWALGAQAELQARGSITSANGGFLYSLPTYPNSMTNAYHPANTMFGSGNDFAHLGLGSPIISNVAAKLAGPPSIASISVNQGPMAGGTTVNITGNAFVGVQSVTFGNVPASSFTVNSETGLSVVSPPQTNSGKVYITIQTPAGVNDYTTAFYYLAGVFLVSPNAGPMQGGTMVTVLGSGFNTQNFPNTTQFLFGGVAASNVYCYNSTECVMNTPAHTAGNVTVQVGQTGTGVNFTYERPAITSISPNMGPTTGGTNVSIHGVSLSPNMQVNFGGTVVGAVCQDSTECWVDSPPGKWGQWHVTVTVNGLTSTQTSNDLFTYAYYPAISSVSPAGGPPAGGTTVTVTGSNFVSIPGAMTFHFGSGAATNVSCVGIPPYYLTSNQCTMTTPAWNSQVDLDPNVRVTATVNGMTSQIVGRFCYGTCTAPPPPPPPGKCTGTSCQ